MARDTDSRPDAPPLVNDQSGQARRDRLKALKRENEALAVGPEAAEAAGIDGESASPINLGSMLAEKQDRLRQLKLLRGFFESPQWVDLTQELVPSSSTREEIEARKTQIAYQIQVLEALLELMRAEHELLSRADLPPAD